MRKTGFYAVCALGYFSAFSLEMYAKAVSKEGSSITMTQVLQQATRKIQGKVTDVNGSPIIGATININGKAKAAAITDVNGEFSMEAPEGAIVNISYIGYEP